MAAETGHTILISRVNTHAIDPPAADLLDRIERRDATVAILGLGYVGLPLLDAVATAGFSVIGIDRDPDKITALSEGRTYLPHLGEDLPARLNNNPRVTLTHDRAQLEQADIILICVPTPLYEDSHEPDLSAVDRAALDIRRYSIDRHPQRPRLVVLESTVYPGATRERLMPMLAHPDAHNYIAHSPEREDPGNKQHSTRTIPKLIGPVDNISGKLAAAFYKQVVQQVVPCRTAEIAESAKLVENIYRAVNIALVNDLKGIFGAMGIDIWEVLDAAATKPFGFQRFDPGPGFGGHCVPIDPFYLAARAREFNIETPFIELAGRINRQMPLAVVESARKFLSTRFGRKLSDASILILGVAYKKNIADLRESPALEIIALLREHNAAVRYHDPHIPRTWPGRRHETALTSIEWSEQSIREHDLVIIVTDHDWYDWRFVATHAQHIIDTRNAIRRHTGAEFLHKLTLA